MEQTDSSQRGGGRGWWREEGGGTRQRAWMEDPWTFTAVWGLTVGGGQGAGQRRAKGENWDNCNRITILKNFQNKSYKS